MAAVDSPWSTRRVTSCALGPVALQQRADARGMGRLDDHRGPTMTVADQRRAVQHDPASRAGGHRARAPRRARPTLSAERRRARRPTARKKAAGPRPTCPRAGRPSTARRRGSPTRSELRRRQQPRGLRAFGVRRLAEQEPRRAPSASSSDRAREVDLVAVEHRAPVAVEPEAAPRVASSGPQRDDQLLIGPQRAVRLPARR